MKKIGFITFLLILALCSLAQNKKIIIEENFDDNKNSWPLINNEEAESAIIKGLYVLTCKNKDISYRFWNNFNLSGDDDFTLEVKLRQVSGDVDNAFGVFFFSKNTEKNYNFEIKSSGYFRTGNKIQNDYDEKDYKPTSYINPKPQYNILTVEKKDNYIYYYINNNLVNVKNFEGLLGDNWGFVVRNFIKIEVDYFKLWINLPEIEIAENVPTGQKINLGSNVNSPYSELIPVIAPDGKTIFFCRNGHPENFGTDKNNDDIWYSKLEGQQWSLAKNIGKPLNNSGHNYVIWVSPDNNKMIVNGIYNIFGESEKNGISITERNPDGTWSIPKPIIIEDFYNDGDYQNFTFSSDLRVIIMSLTRKNDTYGGEDLYISFRKNDGTYTKPKNLGKILNTSKDEGTPFLAPDNTTLYFFSKGHPGYGNADNFVSKRLDDTWLNWSKPKNLGPTINTPKWDAYFTVDAKGEYAYFVSTENSIGEEDIFTIKLTPDIKPEVTVLIYGKVLNKKTNEPIGTKIFYDNLTENIPFDIATSNPKTGEYQIILKAGKKYGFYAKKEGFIPFSDNIDLTNIKEYQEIKRDLYLYPIEQEEVIVLNNIFFEKGKANLLPSSFAELDRLVEIMTKNPNMIIEVQGHTNNIGKREDLMKLSNDRAIAVKNYLVSKGIDSLRIYTVGFGPDKPIASNATEEGRAKNQRVEFKILKK